MTRNEAIKAIVHLETLAEYYCAEGSKRQRDLLSDAYQLRTQQVPEETRKLHELKSILRVRGIL
jgi:vacuolar-type H+-ATPase subunit H